MKRKVLLFIGIGLLTGSTLLAGEKSDIYHKGWIDFNKNGKKDMQLSDSGTAQRL